MHEHLRLRPARSCASHSKVSRQQLGFGRRRVRCPGAAGSTSPAAAASRAAARRGHTAASCREAASPLQLQPRERCPAPRRTGASASAPARNAVSMWRRAQVLDQRKPLRQVGGKHMRHMHAAAFQQSARPAGRWPGPPCSGGASMAIQRAAITAVARGNSGGNSRRRRPPRCRRRRSPARRPIHSRSSCSRGSRDSAVNGHGNNYNRALDAPAPPPSAVRRRCRARPARCRAFRPPTLAESLRESAALPGRRGRDPAAAEAVHTAGPERRR